MNGLKFFHRVHHSRPPLGGVTVTAAIGLDRSICEIKRTKNPSQVEVDMSGGNTGLA